MMKLIIPIILAVLLTTFVLAQANLLTTKERYERRGIWNINSYDPRVNYLRINTGHIEMTSPQLEDYKGVGRGGYPHYLGRGYAYIRSTGSFGFPKTMIDISTKDIPSSFEEKCFFEVWIVDDDTNFASSLGMFYTAMGGTGKFRYTYNNYIGAFDRVLVTQEQFHDTDIGPGKIVLEAAIPASTYYNPPPKPSLMNRSTMSSTSAPYLLTTSSTLLLANSSTILA